MPFQIAGVADLAWLLSLTRSNGCVVRLIGVLKWTLSKASYVELSPVPGLTKDGCDLSAAHFSSYQAVYCRLVVDVPIRLSSIFVLLTFFNINVVPNGDKHCAKHARFRICIRSPVRLTVDAVAGWQTSASP